MEYWKKSNEPDANTHNKEPMIKKKRVNKKRTSDKDVKVSWCLNTNQIILTRRQLRLITHVLFLRCM